MHRDRIVGQKRAEEAVAREHREIASIEPAGGGGGTTCDDPGVAQGGAAGVAYGDSSVSTLFGGSGGGRGGEGDGSCAGGPGGRATRGKAGSSSRSRTT